MDTGAMREQRDSDVVLAVGFGTAVSLWALCYLFRLPGLELPSPALAALLLLALGFGGVWGRVSDVKKGSPHWRCAGG